MRMTRGAGLGSRCLLMLLLWSPAMRSDYQLVAKRLVKISPSVWKLEAARLAAHDTHRFTPIPVTAGEPLHISLMASEGSKVALTIFDNQDNLVSEKNASDHYDFYVLPDRDAEYSAVIVSESNNVISYSLSLSIPTSPPTSQGNTAAESSPSFASVKIFYATDRSPAGTKSNEISFGGEPNAAGVIFGTATVTVPRDHRMGEIEQPSFLHFEYRPDPAKHLTVASMTREIPGEFYRNVKAHVHDSKRHEILLFIHGYNTGFQDGILRTVQLTYDLGFDGAPILYSWPSSGKLLSYAKDERNAILSGAHLKAVLDELLRTTDAQAVHVIAHSMGGRVLTRALELLGNPAGLAKLSDTVFMAPDVDSAFLEQLGPQLRLASSHLTLYASSNDLALQASQFFGGGYSRAGQVQGAPTVLAGVATIDASAVDTSSFGMFHQYYADNRTVLSDLFQLLRGIPPEERFGLEARFYQGQRYWALKPAIR